MSKETAEYIESLELHGFHNVKVMRLHVESLGLSFINNVSEVCETLLKSAELGSAEAQHALAICYIFGLFGYSDKELAAHWCIKSSEAGYPPAIFAMANYNLENQKNDANEHRLNLFEAAERLGYGPAARLLGHMYRDGIDVPRNEDLSRKYFERGSLLNDAESMFELYVSLKGNGDMNENDDGINLLERSASLDYPRAMRELAKFYKSRSSISSEVDKKIIELNHRADLIEKAYAHNIKMPTPLH